MLNVQRWVLGCCRQAPIDCSKDLEGDEETTICSYGRSAYCPSLHSTIKNRERSNVLGRRLVQIQGLVESILCGLVKENIDFTWHFKEAEWWWLKAPNSLYRGLPFNMLAHRHKSSDLQMSKENTPHQLMGEFNWKIEDAIYTMHLPPKRSLLSRQVCVEVIW